MSLDFKLRRSLMGMSYPASVRLPVWMAPLEPRDLAEIIDTPVRVEDVYDEAIALWDSADDKPVVDRALEFFTTFYLQDDILTKVDRAAMMVSLETRAVFLDNDLVEFCRHLPHHFKLRNGERKYLLKQVARRLLPKAIVERKKKGFGIPLAKWLRSVAAEPPLRPIDGMRLPWVRRAWDEHRSGHADHRLFLWTWLSLQHSAEALAVDHRERVLA
jgi:asparagine synthase (glutamine-hydrolysing)